MILCETTNVGKSPLHIVDKIILILDVYLSALDSIYIPSIKMRRRWTDGKYDMLPALMVKKMIRLVALFKIELFIFSPMKATVCQPMRTCIYLGQTDKTISSTVDLLHY